MAVKTETPKMVEVLGGINLQDGNLYFFTTRKTKPSWELGHEMRLPSPMTIAPGGRKQTLPPGTLVRLVGREAVTDLDEVGGYETSVVVTNYRFLWRVERQTPAL